MDFPVPVLLHLKQYLSFQDIRRFRRVNHRWYAIFSKALYANLLVSDKYFSVYDSFYYDSPYGSMPKKVDAGFTYCFEYAELEKSASGGCGGKNWQLVEAFLDNYEAFEHLEVKCLNSPVSLIKLSQLIAKPVLHLKIVVYRSSNVETFGKLLKAYSRNSSNIQIDFPLWVDAEISKQYSETMMYEFANINNLQSLTTHGCIFENPWNTQCSVINLTLIAHQRHANIPIVQALFPDCMRDLIKNGLHTLTVFVEPAYLRGFAVFNWDKLLLEELVERINNILHEVKDVKLRDISYVCFTDPYNEVKILSNNCTLRLLSQPVEPSIILHK